MLRALHISGLGVIDDLELELHPGLNVLTGETGAGKTMITVGLTLALGGRGAASLVREGAAAARIQALFDVPEALLPAAAEWCDDGEVVLARTIGADGRSTARIGGQMATASALNELGRGLVEVHGQHQAQRLLDPDTQTGFLDRFAGDRHVVAMASYREAWEELRQVQGSLGELREATRDRERELDLLAYQVNEIQSVSPQPDETVRLSTEEARLAHVERLLDASRTTEDVLSGEEGVVDRWGSVGAALDDVAALDPSAEGLAQRAQALGAELAELARDVRAYRESLLPDPARLQEVRERIGALRGLQRKYGETDQEVLTFLGEASDSLMALTGADDRLAELTSREIELAEQARRRAGTVTQGRVLASSDLGSSLARELHELGMPGAEIEVVLGPHENLTSLGAEHVELRLAAGAGQAAHPLAKTASGGELSRAMLACRSVLADLDQVPTLVFDEVDAGIGGQAGLAVGRRLARLAADRQVVVVTHLPQIACFADRQINVVKRDGVTQAEALNHQERVEDLSRMLAGLTGSDGAMTHAEELLAEAGRDRVGS